MFVRWAKSFWWSEKARRISFGFLITARRLRWLGHVAWMDEERIPKKLLFGWLPERRPAHGTMRWRDRVRKDLKRFGMV